MSGINQRILELCRAFDRTESPEILREIRELEFQKRKAEGAAERERAEARKAEKNQQLAASNNWDAWYAAIDARIKWWFDHYFDGLGRGNDYRGLYADEIAKALAGLRRQLSGEFKHGIAELCNATGEQREKLREEFRVGIGRLPIAKSWDPDEVCYRGDVVIRDGAVFQCLKDTGKAPATDHPDWILLARAGRDGLTPKIRGMFDIYKHYARLDVVEYEDASYIARRDNPGLCPGDGWQILSRSGRRGPAGEVGPRGRKGEKGAKGDAPEIIGWHLERETYHAFPVLPGGKLGPELNLRPLFEQFNNEVVCPAVASAAR